MEKKIIGQNLRRIRAEKGFTQKFVASASGISYVAYSNIERGISNPKEDTLESIARTLKVSISDIWKRDNPLKYIRFISGSKLISKDKVLFEVEKWLEERIEVDRRLNIASGREFDKLVHRIKSKVSQVEKCDESMASHAASFLRNEWELGKHPILYLGKLFEIHGIKVLGYSLQSFNFSSLSIGTQSGGPAIVINTWNEIPVEEWVFNAAKELGHLILHQELYDVRNCEECEFERQEAVEFACEFLMPSSFFLKEWNYYAFLGLEQAILNIKLIFKVSWKAIVLKFLNLVNRGGDWKFEDDVMWDEVVNALERYKLHPKALKEPNPLSEIDFWGAKEQAQIYKAFLKQNAMEKQITIATVYSNLSGFTDEIMVRESESSKYLITMDKIGGNGDLGEEM
jgi:transcriptional regulator with XRE-family HTH domain/Zn-dependent peptidase ImmA (M78 family)